MARRIDKDSPNKIYPGDTDIGPLIKKKQIEVIRYDFDKDEIQVFYYKKKKKTHSWLKEGERIIDYGKGYNHNYKWKKNNKKNNKKENKSDNNSS